MKKNLFYLGIGVLILLFAFAACNKDDDDDDDDQLSLSEIILSKWEVLQEQQKIYVNNVIFEDTTVAYEDDEMVVEFLSGGQGKMYEYNVLAGTFTWELNGTTLTLNIPGEEEMDFEVVYNVNTHKITLTYSETMTEDNITYKFEMILTAIKI